MEPTLPTQTDTNPELTNKPAPIFSGEVTFSGKTGEFFGIWIVNILLSILTLGIYSAWAKVRTNQYFYRHTRVYGHSFDYLATPIQILIGRILAVILFALYTVTTQFVPVLGLFVALGFVFLVPWLINQGLRFNLRMTRYRNVRFAFAGSYGGAFLNFIVLPILSVFTLYLMLPYVLKRIDQYMHENISFGSEQLNVNLKGETYYLVALIVSVVSGIVMVIFGAVLGAFGLGFENLISDEQQTASAAIAILPILLFIVYYIMFTVISAIYQAMIRNHIFASSEFTDVASFESVLKPLDYAILLFTNGLAIIFSLGLAYPWAKIRKAKMLANVTTVTLYPHALTVIDTKEEQPSSFAEEAANVFDIDISLT